METGLTPCGGRPMTATRDVENVEESDVVQNGCGLFACIVNVHLRNQNGKHLRDEALRFGNLCKINFLG